MARQSNAIVLGICLLVCACGPGGQGNQNGQNGQVAQSDDQQKAEQAQQALADEMARQRAEAERAAAQAAAYKSKIEEVLQADAALSSTSGGSETRQAQGMRAIDLSGCPNDFAAAYTAHIQAWEDAGKIQEELDRLNGDDNVSATIVESIVKDIAGSQDTPIHDAVELNKKLKQDHADAVQRIHDTFNEAERLAVSYGATVPH